MANNLVLVGGPSSGKSNYIARLWLSLSKREGHLYAPSTPDKIDYVEKLVQHLLAGKFAPRSDSSINEAGNDLVVDVSTVDKSLDASLNVPDVLGEVWKDAVSNSQLSERWHTLLTETSSALLFVNAHSQDNSAPLNWVTASELLSAGLGDEKTASTISTQVFLCELLRLLENFLIKSDRKPRIAIVVAAWDKLSPDERGENPIRYLQREFPLFYGRLQDDLDVNAKVFGLSVVGGDLSDPKFMMELLENGIAGSGWVVFEKNGAVAKSPDITVPIQWLLGQEI